MDFSSVLIIGLGALAASMAVAGLDASERRLGLIAYFVHVVASFAHWALAEFFYAGGDIYGYQSIGGELAKLLDLDFTRFAPEVLTLALHGDANLPIVVEGAGSSTGTMSAIAAFFMVASASSLLSLCLISTFASWLGQLCLYRVARAELPVADRPAAVLGFLFVPSVAFWGGGFAKEALVIAFFGVLALSTYQLLRHRKLPYAFGVVAGAVGVAVLKSYTLFAYVLAGAAFFYADRAWRSGGPVRLRPIHLVVASVVAIGGVVAMGRIFPEYQADQLADSLAQRQELWHNQVGGSAIDLGSGDAKSIPQQLVFVPAALANSLLRPAIFDIKNFPSLVGAIENTLIVIALISVVRGQSRGATIESILRTPLLVFAVVFVLVFSVGVGLATSNLGSLSRYRAPMMPFYVMTLLVLRERIRRAAVVQPRSRAVVLARRSRAA